MEADRELFYHGSCKNCHHLHSGCKLQLPADGQIYKGYNCEVCDGHMFGIGMSSPRSSLASLETSYGWNPSSGLTPRPLENVRFCADHLQANTTPQGPSRLSEDQATVAQGSTSRGRSVGSSSQTRLSATHTGPQEAASSTGHTTPNRPNLASAAADVNLQGPYFNPGASRNAKSAPIHSRFAAKHMAKKMLEHLRHHMRWRKAPKIQDPSCKQEVIPPMTKDAGIMTDPISPSTPKPFGEPTPAKNVPTIALPTADEQHLESLARSSQEAKPDEVKEEMWDPVTAKKERIRIQRRQLTLAKERLAQRVCLCGDGCHCMGGGTQETVAPTSRRYGDLSNLDLSRVPQHQLDHLLRSSTTSSSFSQPPFRNPSPSRRVAFAGAHLETPYPPPQDLSIPSEDGDEQRFSRVSTSTGMTLTSQVTTAVNSSSSGSGNIRRQGGRMNSLPILTPQQFDHILDLLRVDRSRPESQSAFRLLTLVSAPYAETSASGQGPTRTNSMDVASTRQSMFLEGINGHHPSTYHDSTMSLPHVPEPGEVPPVPTSLTNGHHVADTGDSADDVTPQPRAPVSVAPAPDQLSSELEELARRPGN